MKYLVVLKSSIARIFSYRLNFFLGRLRNIVVLLLFYYVWKGLTVATGSFAGYTEMELITYVFGVNILRSIILGGNTRDLVEEINNGIFSKYLTEPLNIWWYEFYRDLGHRLLHLFSAFVEGAFFIWILQVDLLWQQNFVFLGFSILASLLAVLLYQSLTFFITSMAFWTREAMGPRFLFDWVLEFASGSYFPLSILSPGWFIFLGKLPFFYIIFFPLSIYLGNYSLSSIIIGLVWQVLWIGVMYMLNSIFWDKGLKRYSGEGI